MGVVMKGAERDAFYDELVCAVSDGELTWGEAVRELRVKVAGLDQATFARVTKISVRTLRHLEHGTGNPTLSTLRAVLTPFGIELTMQRVRRG